MSELPFMPLAVDSWDADTSHLSDAQDGLYGRLVRLLWKSPGQRIPNDNAWLAHKLRRTVEAVESEVRPLLKEFFQTDGNWIKHTRVTKEWRRAIKATRQRSVAAKARWNKEKEASGRNAEKRDAAVILTPTLTLTPTLKESKTECVETPSPESAREDEIDDWPAEHDGVAVTLRPPSDHRSRGQRPVGELVNGMLSKTGPPERRLKRQDRAEGDLLNVLQTKLGRTPEDAWKLVISATSPEDPDYERARKECKTISRNFRLGWFPEESPN